MEKQEIFDKVVAHLRKQGCKAISNSRCKYRTSSGLKCAAGCLISDKDYNSECEDNAIPFVIKLLNLKDLEPHADFITELQSVHDNSNVEEWEDQLEFTAKRWHLIYTPPECK